NTENFNQPEVQDELNQIIANDFDKEQALKELNAQVNITQAFDAERRAIRSEFAKKAGGYRKQAEKLSDDDPRKEEFVQQAQDIEQKLRIFDGITSALYAPNSNGIIGDVSRTVSPELAYRIGQEFKRKDQEGSAQHLLAHAILGAAVSYATDNNITTGALSGAGGEVAAPALANYLYGTKYPETLSQGQKDTITSILNLATATAIYTTTDGSTTDAVSGAEIGKVGVEWNHIATKTGKLFGKVSDETYEIARDNIIPRNSALAGKLHPKTQVPFDNQGYPDFSAYLYRKNGKNVDVNIGALTGNRTHDDALANAAAGFDKTPNGYTWHHQDLGRMQLVKTDIHQKTGHTGGYSIYSKAIAISTGLITSIKEASADDYADFVFSLLTPIGLTSTTLADGTPDGFAREKGFRDYPSYLDFQKRLEELKKNSKFK
ncbi:HNH endonuclease, partial [Moraxella oculi]